MYRTLAWIGLLLSSLLACAGNSSEARSPDEVSSSEERSDARECHRPDMFGPALISAAEYAARHGARASTFGEVKTDRELPLEECGLRAVLERPVPLTCSDGTHPFAGDLRAAHRSRGGSVGPGGRCSSIIDRYTVPCADGPLDVYADMYVCVETGDL